MQFTRTASRFIPEASLSTHTNEKRRTWNRRGRRGRRGKRLSVQEIDEDLKIKYELYYVLK
jgi:hypothetical protein